MTPFLRSFFAAVVYVCTPLVSLPLFVDAAAPNPLRFHGADFTRGDTASCNRLLAQAIKDVSLHPEQANEAIQRAARIAKQHNYARGQAAAALLGGMLHAFAAQTSRADSAWREGLVLEPFLGTDSVIAALHYRLGESALLASRFEDAETHLKEAHRKWVVLDESPGRTDALYLLCVWGMLSRNADMEKRYDAELVEWASPPSHVRARAYLAMRQAKQHIDLGQFDSAMTCYRQAYDLFATGSLFHKQSEALMGLGNLMQRQGQLDSAVSYYQRAIALQRKYHERRFMFGPLTNIGNVHYLRGRYEDATEAFLAALDLGRSVGSPIYIMVALGNVGLMLSEQKENDKALRYFREAVDVAISNGLEHRLTVVYLNIGIIHLERKELDSALTYCQRAVRVAKMQGDEGTLGGAYLWLGDTQLAMGRMDAARESYRSGLTHLQNSGNVHGILEGQLRLSDMEAAEGNLDAAIQAATTVLAGADSIQAYNLSGEALKRLGPLYEKKGDSRTAYEYNLRSAAVKDSLLNQENMKTLQELSARYESEQREKEIALQRRDLALKDLDLTHQQEELLRRRIDARRRVQTIALLRKQGEIDQLEQAQTESELAQQRSEAARQKQQAELLQTRNRLQATQLDQATVNRNTMLGGLAVLIVITVLLFRRYRERKRSGEEIARTLDELRRTQDQLIHAEKMGTLGEMTAGIAHEIRNPMNFISNFAQAARELSDDARTAIDSDNGELPSVLEQLSSAARPVCVRPAL